MHTFLLVIGQRVAGERNGQLEVFIESKLESLQSISLDLDTVYLKFVKPGLLNILDCTLVSLL